MQFCAREPFSWGGGLNQPRPPPLVGLNAHKLIALVEKLLSQVGCVYQTSFKIFTLISISREPSNGSWANCAPPPPSHGTFAFQNSWGR